MATSATSNSAAGKVKMLGVNMGSAKTLSARATATKYFNEFLHTIGKPLGLDAYLLINDSFLCEPDTFRRFGYWLMEYAVTIKTPRVPLTADYASAIITSICTKVAKQFPEHHTWQKNELNRWYADLKNDLNDKMYKRMQMQGIVSGGGALPVGTKMMRTLSAALFLVGTHAALVKMAVLLVSRSAAGRGGEVALAEWTSAAMCEVVQSFEHNWNKMKTKRCDVTNHFVSHDGPETCVIYALSALAMFGGCLGGIWPYGNRAFMFPDLALNPVTAADKVTDYLREAMALTNEYKDRKDEFSSGGLRGGALDEIVMNKDVMLNPSVAAFRTSHDPANLCRVFKYLDITRACTMVGGLAIAGWPLPFLKIVPPFLAFLNNADDFGAGITAEGHDFEFVQNLMVRLYVQVVPDMAPGKRLWGMAKFFLAVELMWLPITVQRYSGNIRIQRLVDAAIASIVDQQSLERTRMTFHRMLTKLVEWGKVIRHRFLLDNAAVEVRSSNQPVEVLVAQVVSLQTQNQELQHVRPYDCIEFFNYPNHKMFSHHLASYRLQ